MASSHLTGQKNSKKINEAVHAFVVQHVGGTYRLLLGNPEKIVVRVIFSMGNLTFVVGCETNKNTVAVMGIRAV